MHSAAQDVHLQWGLRRIWLRQTFYVIFGLLVVFIASRLLAILAKHHSEPSSVEGVTSALALLSSAGIEDENGMRSGGEVSDETAANRGREGAGARVAVEFEQELLDRNIATSSVESTLVRSTIEEASEDYTPSGQRQSIPPSIQSRAEQSKLAARELLAEQERKKGHLANLVALQQRRGVWDALESVGFDMEFTISPGLRLRRIIQCCQEYGLFFVMVTGGAWNSIISGEPEVGSKGLLWTRGESALTLDFDLKSSLQTLGPLYEYKFIYWRITAVEKYMTEARQVWSEAWSGNAPVELDLMVFFPNSFLNQQMEDLGPNELLKLFMVEKDGVLIIE